MDSITLLTAPGEGARFDQPVSKTIRKDGTIEKPFFSITWKARQVQITCLRDLLFVLTELENSDNTILIRGKFAGGNPNNTCRRKTEFHSTSHNWGMIDVDEILLPDDIDPISCEAAEYAIKLLPESFHDVDYILAFSSSAGFAAHKAKLHLFFMFDQKVTDQELKEYFGELTVDIDVSVFSSIQPHLVNRPKFEDPTMDPFGGGSRIKLVEKGKPFVCAAGVKTPRGLKNTYKGVGVSKTKPEPVSKKDCGLHENGRETFLRNLVFKMSHEPFTSIDALAEAVWSLFQQNAVVGPTAQSPNSYSIDDVYRKCQSPKIINNLTKARSQKTTIPTKYVSREAASEEIKAGIQAFFRNKENTGLIATAGSGKSKIAQSIIANLPNLKELNIEVYAPTLELAAEWSRDLKGLLPEADVRLLKGRSAETCNKFDIVKPFMDKGAGVLHHVCFKSKSNHCEHWRKCLWSCQDPDNAPAIRIMAHSYLAMPRPKQMPVPDYVVIDESFLDHAVKTAVFPSNFLLSTSALQNHLGAKKVKGPKTSWTTDPITLDIEGNLGENERYIREEDLSYLKTIGRMAYDLLQSSNDFFKHLRENNIGPDELERCNKTIVAFTPFIDVDPSMPDDEKLRKLDGYKNSMNKELGLLRRMYRMLAAEMRLGRKLPVGVKQDDNSIALHYKPNLARLESVPVLILDADLEPEILKWILPVEKVLAVHLKYHATVNQVSGNSFSKSSLGLSKFQNPNTEKSIKLRREIESFLESLDSPEQTLIITYQAYQDILTGSKKGFSKTERGQTVGHFGNVRGIDKFKDFINVVIIGRYARPDHVIDQNIRALTQDVLKRPTSELGDALYRAYVPAETNQAVARLRMVHAKEKKNVYLLSSEPVPFIVDEKLSWADFLAGGSRATKLFKKYGVIPLSAKKLRALEPELFRSNKEAEKWVENNYSVGTEDGSFRVLGAKGKAIRYVCPPETESPSTAIQALYEERLVSFKGSETCLFFDEVLYRSANCNYVPDFLHNSSIFIGKKVEKIP